MITVTNLEAMLLRNVAENNYTDMPAPETWQDAREISVWTHAVEDNGPTPMNSKQVRALLTTCKRKGLIWQDAECIGLTEDGFNAYRQQS